jgi:REP element-mobilizing transposase RayT
VTGGTLHKEHFFRRPERLRLVQSALFDVITDYGWSLQAWAIFSNHYHIIARSPEICGDGADGGTAQADKRGKSLRERVNGREDTNPRGAENGGRTDDRRDEENPRELAAPDETQNAQHTKTKPKTIRNVIQRLHSQTSREVNRLDGVSGRQVWFQFRDTCLTYEKSYYARLNYVHHNPVKHGMAETPEQYEFCSAIWFNLHADISFRKKVESFGFDEVRIDDDY